MTYLRSLFIFPVLTPFHHVYWVKINQAGLVKKLFFHIKNNYLSAVWVCYQRKFMYLSQWGQMNRNVSVRSKERLIAEPSKKNAAAAAKSLQSCPTLCDPIDGSPPGSAIPGILQARTLEWVAISFYNAWKWKVKVKSLSCVRLLAIPWTAAYQAPPSMGFSRQEY